jgi:hypothetical protein
MHKTNLLVVNNLFIFPLHTGIENGFHLSVGIFQRGKNQWDRFWVGIFPHQNKVFFTCVNRMTGLALSIGFACESGVGMGKKWEKSHFP